MKSAPVKNGQMILYFPSKSGGISAEAESSSLDWLSVNQQFEATLIRPVGSEKRMKIKRLITTTQLGADKILL